VEAAASDEEGGMKFFHQGDAHKGEVGFSVVNRDIRWAKTEKYAEEVSTIRLATWIDREIIKRSIPEKPPSGKVYEKSIIGMKLDVEGSEYVVMPDLLLSGTYCKIDFVFSEFHPRFAPFHFDNLNVTLHTIDDAIKFGEVVQGIMGSSRKCRTKISWFDDESYFRDNIPLPTSDGG